MFREFREFIARGNVLDLAVAVIIGGAFGTIVTSLTGDVIMPVIGAIFGGAIGVGIGIGLQNIFNNFLSGIVLLFEKTLKVGDFVELECGLVGRVAEIDMRYTRITTNDLVDVMVPNSQFTDNRVTNWSYGEQTRRLHVPFGVAYTARKEEVRAAGIEAAG